MLISAVVERVIREAVLLFKNPFLFLRRLPFLVTFYRYSLGLLALSQEVGKAKALTATLDCVQAIPRDEGRW